LKQWDSTNLIKTGDRDNLVFVDSPCAEGTKCVKITLRPDIIFEPYNQSRVEVKHVGLHTLNGEDSYYAWSFMVPKDAEIRSNIGYWESTPTSLNTMTFFIEPGPQPGGGTNVKFGTGDLGKTVQWTAKLELNKWHRMAIHNHWSQGSDGKVDVWYDGTQVVTNVTATKRDANKLFFQMGLHRSDPAPPIQDIYLDAAIEADSQADILAPLPDPAGMGGSGGTGGTGGSGARGGAAPSCSARTACANPDLVCDTDTGLCVECLDDTDCAPQHCDVTQHLCVDCLLNADCPKTAPSCSTGHTCGATCTNSGSCSTDTPVCETSTHTCVECLIDADCAPDGVCQADRTCS